MESSVNKGHETQNPLPFEEGIKNMPLIEKPPRFDYMTSSPDRYQILKGFARENRLKMTDAETVLWEELRRLPRPFKFRRQHIIGDFIADFVCLEYNLIIEIDGGYHAEPQQQYDDATRTEILNNMGFDVIRFTNKQVIENQQEVITEIKNILYNK